MIKKICPNFVNNRFLQKMASSIHNSSAESFTQYHEFSDCMTGIKRKIAYEKINGPKKIGVLFIPGFLSCKHSIKATNLLQYCKDFDFPYVRYDPAGLGQSTESLKLKDARFSHWLQDAEEVLLNLTEGPQIVIGSSMGGWISIYLAVKYPEKFAALFLIAPGLNFTDRMKKNFSKVVPPEVKDRFDSGETLELDYSDYGVFPLSLSLIDGFKPYEIDLHGEVRIDCPIRIRHGLKDKDVPYEESLLLLKSLTSKDAQLQYIKEGDHSLSDKENLKAMWTTVLELYNKLTDLPQSTL